MALSGLSGSMMKAYAEHTVESGKDTRTLIDTQDTRAVAAAEQQMFMKDRANKEHMKKQLFETVKAGVKTAQAVGKVGETSQKVGESQQIEQNIKTAIENNDLQALKDVKMDETHTVGQGIDDQRLQTLLTAPGEGGQPPTIDEQVARIQGAANPRRVELRAAVESGDMDRIRGAAISDDSTLGDTMGDAKIRELMTKPGKDGQPPSLDEQVNRLQGTAQRREVTPDKVRDNLLGELDRVAGHILDNRRSDDEKGSSETAKNKGDIKARRSEMYAQLGQDQQTLAQVSQLAADAHRPLVG